jgi:hypothetical protein
MLGLVPGIHVLLLWGKEVVDGRDEPGYDVENVSNYYDS